MKAFHGKQEIKDKYLARVRAHREADNLVQGICWNNGKGCAVGCTLENYDHELYPKELGLPIWIARLEDRIFEALPNDEAQSWPEEFLEAILVGADVDLIFHDTLIWIVESTLQTFDHKEFPQVKEAIDGVVSALKNRASVSELRRAARAANAAAPASCDAAVNAARAANAAALAVSYAAVNAASYAAASYAADAYAAGGNGLKFWRGLREFLLTELSKLRAELKT